MEPATADLPDETKAPSINPKSEDAKTNRSSRTVYSPVIERGVAEATRLNVPDYRKGVWVQAYFRLSFAISQWINLLDPRISFETVFVSLSNEELDALLAVGRALTKSVPAAQEDMDCLTLLEQRIDQSMAPLQDASKQVFLKLDSRSPKDVVWEVKSIGEPLVREALEERGLLHGDNCATVHEGLQVMFQTLHNTGLAVKSGAEAVSRLVNSFRCLEDLGALRELRNNDFPLDNAICLRRFDKRVATGKWPEFRAFVHANRLTAISQYDRRYNDKLHKAEQEVQTLLESFFAEHVQRALQHIASYIIDFAIVERGEEGDSKALLPETGPLGVKVVELNSFESWTGACLFSWSADQEVLLHGLADSSRAAFRTATEDDETQLSSSSKGGLEEPSDESVSRALNNVPGWAKELLVSQRYAQRLQTLVVVEKPTPQAKATGSRCVVS